MICEWLPIPFRMPCIRESDFQIEMPTELNEDEYEGPSCREPRPRFIQYHIAMIKVAQIIHRFRAALRLGSALSVSRLVMQADDSLANLIESLPHHLRAGEDHSFEATRYPDEPWIPWQRTNLSLVLFYHRIVINRVLQDQWVQDPVAFQRTRSICLGSARGIIDLAKGFEGSVARRRPW